MPLSAAARYGLHRVLDGPGVFPQPAQRLDNDPRISDAELLVSVERLNLDSASFRQLRGAAGDDAVRIAEEVERIVAERGKMHNPETDSGGVLLGTVTAVGERYASPPAVGERIVTLASLTMTPLRLEAVTGLDPDSPQAEVTGTAYLCERGAWATLPDDLPVAKAVDVESTSAMTPEGSRVIAVVALRGKPRRAVWAPLIDKTRRRVTEVPIEYRGFEVGDEYLVGYGLDWQGYYRNLRSIWAVLDMEAFVNDPKVLFQVIQP